MPTEFDRYAETYDRVLAASLGSAGDIDRFAAYKVDEIAYRLRGTAVRRVLDFGCGVGRSLPFIASTFPSAELWGFDPSLDSAQAARKRESRAQVIADWNEIPIGAFDCVMAANVFHHVEADARESEMGRCAAALADTGSLFVFEHNPLNPLTRYVFERCPFDRDATMIRRKEIVRLGTLAGLRVRRAAFTLFLPFSGKFVASIQRGLAWLPLGAQYYVQFVR
jgi:SAM-dependent methyltransferase